MQKLGFKRISAIAFLLALGYGVYYVVNLVWFRPANLGQFFVRYFVEASANEPEKLTQIRPEGLAQYGYLLDKYDERWRDLSPAATEKSYQQAADAQATLTAYADERISTEDSIAFFSLQYELGQILAGKDFRFHQYLLNPIDGEQKAVLRTLCLDQPIDSREAAEAYYIRLRELPKHLEQLIDASEHRYRMGITPPRWMLEQSIAEMKAFIATKAEENVLYVSFAHRAAKADPVKLSEADAVNNLRKIKKILIKSIYPAYIKLIEYSLNLQQDAPDHDGAAWQLPNGNAYYRYSLSRYADEPLNTAPMPIDSVHALGLRQVAYFNAEIQRMLDSVKRHSAAAPTQKAAATIGEALQSLNSDAAYRYPATDSGSLHYRERYRTILDDISEKMKGPFHRVPATYLNAEPMPSNREAYFPEMYYTKTKKITASGEKKGYSLWLNMRRYMDFPTWQMRTHAYAEAIPGGHYLDFWQDANSDRRPPFLLLYPFAAYRLGWKAYSEQLVDELYFYTDNEPLDRIGYLRGQLLRWAKLVTDTGIHHKHWTRAQGAAYLQQTVGISEVEATHTVAEILVQPAAACAEPMGLYRLLALRARMKALRQDNFLIQDFHSYVLERGALPLPLLEKWVK